MEGRYRMVRGGLGSSLGAEEGGGIVEWRIVMGRDVVGHVAGVGVAREVFPHDQLPVLTSTEHHDLIFPCPDWSLILRLRHSCCRYLYHIISLPWR